MELPLFAGPSFAFGSYDLAFGTDGRLLATGLFGGDVVAFDAAGTPSTFVSGLTFASGVTVNGFTGRVEMVSSFSGTDEERSMHRFVPVERLETGRGRRATECVLELYGLELVAQGQSTTARNAICVDGAPCDADGMENDRCLFPLGFCLNVDDPRVPECAPATPVVSAAVRVVPFSAAADTAAIELAAALPEQDAMCVFSDGVVVPVRHTAQGRKAGTARLRTEAVLGSGEKDVDRLRMICEPIGP
jgi:hypothetical protein